MGWLSKIFKGSSSHKISEGQYQGILGDDKVWDPPSYSVPWNVMQDIQSQYENEELDHAIALSLVEEEKRKENGIVRLNFLENDSHLEEDEALARALQASLDMESPPQTNDNSTLYQPPPYPFLTGFRICAGCNNEIGRGRFLSCMGAVWHPECFRCHSCNQPISEFEFSMSGNYPYHKSCYRELYHPKCDVCKQFPRDTQYISLGDGRKLCLECLDSAIMDNDECQPLYLEIRDFYEGLNMKVEQQIPLLLVERQALNEALEGEKQGHHHLPETRGLCLSEEQTVSTLPDQNLLSYTSIFDAFQILRRPKIGTGNSIIDMITEPYRLIRRCEVTAIL
ncbi:DA1-related 1 protein [Nymphaea thermarum]|nr:DA1-related 1 protein [Nymphaea thermarum]